MPEFYAIFARNNIFPNFGGKRPLLPALIGTSSPVLRLWRLPSHACIHCPPVSCRLVAIAASVSGYVPSTTWAEFVVQLCRWIACFRSRQREREGGGERRGFLTRYHSRTMTLAPLLPTKLAFERLLLAETLGSNVWWIAHACLSPPYANVQLLRSDHK